MPSATSRACAPSSHLVLDELESELYRLTRAPASLERARTAVARTPALRGRAGEVQDCLQALTRCGIGESDAGHLASAEPTAGVEHLRPKRAHNLVEGGLSRLSDLARQLVGVHDGDAALREKPRSGGFAHPHTAR